MPALAIYAADLGGIEFQNGTRAFKQSRFRVRLRTATPLHHD